MAAQPAHVQFAMPARFLPELSHYRTCPERAHALSILLSQLRIRNLVLTPRLLLITAGGWLILQATFLLIAPSRPPLYVALALGLASWGLLIGAVLGSALGRARPALRRDLILRGTPLCLRCGSLIAGPAPPLCPKCGRDTSDQHLHLWEPPPEMAIYPQLAECRSREEAATVLERARARAGSCFVHPQATWGVLVVLLVIFWHVFAFVADQTAAHFRRDLPEKPVVAAAVASFLLLSAGWYGLIVARVGRQIPRVITEGRTRDAAAGASPPEHAGV